MKLKKVEKRKLVKKEEPKKRMLKKVEPKKSSKVVPFKKKLPNIEDAPKRKLVKKVDTTNPFRQKEVYTGKYKDLFPYRPRKKSEVVITTKQQLKHLSEALMQVEMFAFDTETNTLAVLAENKKFKCVGISISYGESNNYYIPLGHVREEDLDLQLDLDLVVENLKKPFAREDVCIVAHNFKFDMHVLKRIGIEINSKKLFDTMLASWLCDENTLSGLKENSLEKMGLDQTHFKEATGTVPKEVLKQFGLKANSRVPFDLVLIKDGAPYAIDDAFYTLCLSLGFVKLLEHEKMDKIYYSKSIPYMLTLFEKEEHGVDVDVEKLKQMGIEMAKDLEELQYKVYELAGVKFNIGSTQQKAEILYGWRKPDKLIDFNAKKVSKVNLAMKEKVLDFRRGIITEEEFSKALKKNAMYYDTKTRQLWKIANRNEEILSKTFGFKCEKLTDTGNPSSDADAIWDISKKQFTIKRKQQGAKMCEYLGQYSKLAKLKSAFADGILEKLYADGKAHPNFKQIGTDSGRISCAEPNLQQLPNARDSDKYQIRSAFIGGIDEVTGKRKMLIAVDYHNLEMVCLTYFSKDKNLTNMFANDEDAHGSTAVNMFRLDCTSEEVKKEYPHLRQAAKTINFLLMYGGGAKLLYEKLRDDHESPLDLGSKKYLEEYGCRNGKEVAQKMIDMYFKEYSGVANFIAGQKRFAKKNGCTYTILGRKRRLPDINSSDMGVASYNERLSVNSPVQGTAGDITSSAQIRINNDNRLKELRCDMIIQVHDEIVFECPEEHVDEAISIIKYYMEHPFGDSKERQVPYLRADDGRGWTYQEAK